MIFDDFPAHYTLDDVFTTSVINCLPGTFYIYQILPEAVKMKRWNKAHRDAFGLTDSECYDRTPFSYVDPDYHHILADAIKRIEELGSAKQVLINIIDKHQNKVPYVFEGYKFMLGNELFFMGVGLNVSDLVSAKEQIKLLALEKEKTDKAILKKEKELLALTLSENQNNDILKNVSIKLEYIVKHYEGHALETEILHFAKTLNNHVKVKDNWNDFKELFVNIHKDFLKNLKTLHPDLSPTEIRFCAYLKINMSSNNLCTVMNISKEGLKKKRYRLKKKLLLKTGVSFRDYLNTI